MRASNERSAQEYYRGIITRIGEEKMRSSNANHGNEDEEASSQIFRPFRALGVVTNEIPFSLYSIKADDYIITCTGKSYQVFDISKKKKNL